MLLLTCIVTVVAGCRWCNASAGAVALLACGGAMARVELMSMLQMSVRNGEREADAADGGSDAQFRSLWQPISKTTTTALSTRPATTACWRQ